MSNIKHQIILGNCGNDINTDLISLPTEDSIYRADTTVLKADNTIYTADYNL